MKLMGNVFIYVLPFLFITGLWIHDIDNPFQFFLPLQERTRLVGIVRPQPNILLGLLLDVFIAWEVMETCFLGTCSLRTGGDRSYLVN
jgi:hypothetical protein